MKETFYFLSIVVLVAVFQCPGLLFCTLLPVWSPEAVNVHLSDNDKTIPQGVNFAPAIFSLSSHHG